MRDISVMLWALFVAILLSACTTTQTGEGLSSSNPGDQRSSAPADREPNSPADQKPVSTADQKTTSAADQKTSSPAEKKLAQGIASYENGNFKLSEAEIRKSLNLGLSGKHDQVLAHKYLAFIYCVSKRKTQCRDEFRKALKIDPAFDLDPAEVGQPIWGPIFLNEKSKYKK